MGVRVEQVDLPGIGVRHDVVTEDGRQVSVVAHRSGERTLGFTDADDPDACTASVSLTEEEAAAVADVLGAAVVLSRLSELRDQAAGLFTEQIQVPTGSPYVGRPLSATQARTRTGASVVALLRDDDVIASPGPDVVFAAGDTIVAVGTRSGLDALAQIVAAGPS
ncbi:potassium/proton antiporter regulatory subunit (CPA2 family) [Haloactinopolyspora alba]|uniref:Potassium/proton antiporter regulatory subunit (CPA2 family) n=1 Tax=Haloactinopolyspora alba TaxID=648780 RepID=A0A2P8DM00_9ACTN|nr:cation:proton antiporter regulatory subunit [Haloactinopolyspora alba]PSK98217.1 potassium/proton antiporter regulatory subunit (CPA2 family) [Haloactinopolyspora alba]